MSTRFDTADYPESPDDIAAYLDAALEENDPKLTTLVGVLNRLGLRLSVTPLPN